MIGYWANHPQLAVALVGGDDAGTFFEAAVSQRGVGLVTNIASLRSNVAGLVDFGRMVGKFYFTLFIVDSNALNSLLLADIPYDLVDIVAGIVHHGVMGAQLNRVAQTFGFSHDVLAQSLLLIPDAEVGPS